MEWVKFSSKHQPDKEEIIDEILINYDVTSIIENILNKNKTEKVFQTLLEKIITPQNFSSEIIIAYSIYLANQCDDSPSADILLVESIKHNPNDKKLLSSYANFLSSMEIDDQKAKEIYSKIITKDTKDIDLLLRYAKLLSKDSNENLKSKELLKSILEVNAYHFESIVLIARIFWSEKDYSLAEKYYRNALSIVPNDVELCLRVGQIFYNKGLFKYSKNLILLAVNGNLLKESKETQLEVLFYGLLVVSHFNSGSNRADMYRKILDLLSKDSSIMFKDINSTLFSAGLPEEFEWNGAKEELFIYLTKRKTVDADIDKLNILISRAIGLPMFPYKS